MNTNDERSSWYQWFISSCTPREKEVAELLIEGKTQSEIARQLKLSTTRISLVVDRLRFRIRRAKGIPEFYLDFFK